MENSQFAVIGAGLAGCECALTLADCGFEVSLFEQKPQFRSEAHASDLMAELVCSNSLRSNEITSGVGLLKEEMRQLGSRFMRAAERNSVAAGKALAVDREGFAGDMTRLVSEHPRIRIVRRRIDHPEDAEALRAGPLGVVVAAGPMASAELAASLARIAGEENCYFYDAIAPIVWSDSLDKNIVFRASRYEDGPGDYLNCPMDRAEYEAFHAALCAGKTCAAHAFEEERHFEGCMPIEALAARGPRTLTFGPMKPVGLVDPRTGARPWAVLQLRPEKTNMEACNLVGCQTKLLHDEQERVFRLVPGMAKAEFVRHGSMHRNTFVNAPRVLAPDLSLRARPGIYLAGQITGVEGYVESAACGLWLALHLAMRARGRFLPRPPAQTALGALLGHLEHEDRRFQPSNVNFGLMPEPERKLKKKERKEYYASRARAAFADWLAKTGCPAAAAG